MRPLNKGDKIAVIAPANTMASMPEKLIQIGLERMNTLGYRIQLGQNVNKKHFHTAGTIEERVADFHQSFSNQDIAAVMAVYGGYNSNHLLDHLDYNLIKSNPKLLIGYSDVSALLNAVYAQTSLVSLHGVSFASFCDPNMFPEAIESFVRIVNGEAPIELTAPKKTAHDLWYLKKEFGPRDTYPHSGWSVLTEGEAKGKLLGGNLETFLALAGTPYFPSCDSCILLLESAPDEKPAKFDREITQLKQMGILSSIAGLIIGQFPSDSPLATTETMRSILEPALGGQAYPILLNASFSHVDPIYTLPIGREVILRADENPTVVVCQSIYEW